MGPVLERVGRVRQLASSTTALSVWLHKFLTERDGHWVPLPRLVGQVVKASASEAEDPRFYYHLSHRDFSGVESYQ